MKLTDKRFWKFEAMMLLCGVILVCQMLVALLCNEAEFESCNGAVLILLFPALCLYFVIYGVPTWLVYKGIIKIESVFGIAIYFEIVIIYFNIEGRQSVETENSIPIFGWIRYVCAPGFVILYRTDFDRIVVAVLYGILAGSSQIISNFSVVNKTFEFWRVCVKNY